MRRFIIIYFRDGRTEPYLIVDKDKGDVYSSTGSPLTPIGTASYLTRTDDPIAYLNDRFMEGGVLVSETNAPRGMLEFINGLKK